MVGLPGLEPGTSVLSGPRSNHLSYRPNYTDREAVTGRRATRNVPPAIPVRNPDRPEDPTSSSPGEGSRSDGLPRKEVIQPHLPVRLPCYDFVPITGFALDGWPPEGLPRRLQAPP